MQTDQSKNNDADDDVVIVSEKPARQASVSGTVDKDKHTKSSGNVQQSSGVKITSNSSKISNPSIKEVGSVGKSSGGQKKEKTESWEQPGSSMEIRAHLLEQSVKIGKIVKSVSKK